MVDRNPETALRGMPQTATCLPVAFLHNDSSSLSGGLVMEEAASLHDPSILDQEFFWTLSFGGPTHCPRPPQVRPFDVQGTWQAA